MEKREMAMLRELSTRIEKALSEQANRDKFIIDRDSLVDLRDLLRKLIEDPASAGGYGVI